MFDLNKLLNKGIVFRIIVFLSIASAVMTVMIVLYQIAITYLSYKYKYGGVFEVGNTYVSDSTDAISVDGLLYLYDNGQCKTPWRYGLRDSLSKGTWKMLTLEKELRIINFDVADTVMEGQWRIYSETLYESSGLRGPYVSHMTICNKRLCMELYRIDRYFATVGTPVPADHP